MHFILKGRYSGAEILVRDLALHQKANGHEVGILALEPTEDDFIPIRNMLIDQGILWYEPLKSIRRIQRILHVRKYSLLFQPSFVFAHSIIPAFYARSAWIIMPYLAISVLHSANCQDYPKGDLIERFISKRSSAIVGVNKDALEYYNKYIAINKNSLYIPNGVNIDNIFIAKEQRESVRTAYGIGLGTKIIIQVGRIDPVKGQAQTIKAFIRATELGCVNSQLWIIGIVQDAEYSEECKKLAKNKPIHFLGGQSSVANYLAAADLYVMPSKCEAMSVAFVEGLVSGLPIIANEIPSFREHSTQPGVKIINTNNINLYTESIAFELKNARRYIRSIDHLSIQSCAHSYDKLIERLNAER